MIELSFNEYGEPDAPPLLILHGFLGTSGNWHTLSRNVFAKTHHVFALDLRNHGDSPHDDEFSYGAMAEDVRFFIESRGLPPVDIIGHSMGGKVAMELSIRRPDLIRNLVVVDIAPGPGVRGHAEILVALESVGLDEATSRRDVDQHLAKTIPSAPVRQFLLKNLRSNGDGRYAWKNNLPVLVATYDAINHPVTDGVFDKPTLFIRGGKSDYIRSEDWPDIIARFPNAQRVDLENAGHWVHAEAPVEFADAVSAFLSVNDL